MRRTLHLKDLDAFFDGAELLGCGGGGDIRTGELLASEALASRPVEVLDIAEAIRQDLHTVPVGIVGAAGGVLDERLPHGREFETVVNSLASMSGVPIGAVMAIESGGVNGLVTLWVASSLNLPVVDADLCGRAVPRLDQMTAGFGGRNLTPMVCVDPDGRRIDFGLSGQSYDATRLENMVRALLVSGSGWLGVGFRPLSPTELPEAVVPGSHSRCLEFGRELARWRACGEILQDSGMAAVALGQILGWRRGNGPGVDRIGWILVDSPQGLIRIDMQSEILRVSIDGEIVAEVPDLLALVDISSFTVVPLESLRIGQQIAIVTAAVGCPKASEEYLAKVGPSGYGLERQPQ